MPLIQHLKLVKIMLTDGTTAVRVLTRSLVTLPRGASRRLQWSETGMEDPQEDRQCIVSVCVVGTRALWEISLGLSRSVEWTLCLSSLILGFSVAFIVSYHLLLGSSYCVISYNCFLCVSCSGLVVSTCQVIG